MAQGDKDEPPFGGLTFNEAMDASEPDDPWVASLKDAEEQSKKFQAAFVNRVFVKPEGRHLRITFGESVGGDNVYHSSIVMTVEDAYEFGQLLTQQAGGALVPLMEHYRQLLALLDKDRGQQETR